MTNEFMSTEWTLQWLEKHCQPQSVIDELNRVADEVAQRHCDAITDEMIAETETFSFNVDDFPENDRAFAATMFKFGKRFADTEDIEVRYTKIENSEGVIKPTFTIRNLPLIKQHIEEAKAKKS